MESDCNEFSNCDDSFAQLQDTGCASTFAGCNNAGDYGPPGADSNNDLPDAPTPNDGVCQSCSGEDVALNVSFIFDGSAMQAEDIEPEIPEPAKEGQETAEEPSWITMEPGETLEDVFGTTLKGAEEALGNHVFDWMTPGPLPDSIAVTFAGGRYVEAKVGPDGWMLQDARVAGGVAGEFGRNGTFYNPTPPGGRNTKSYRQCLTTHLWQYS
jgi:hypothetical protein